MPPKKLPAFQFYPGDWMKDPAVRCLSLAARGLWFDMLCLMHESPRRGYLQHPSGKRVEAVQLARMVGGEIAEVAALLDEIADAGASSETAQNVVYCRRMVRDERKRQKCSEAGKKGGGNPALQDADLASAYKGGSKGDDKGTPKQKQGSSVSSSVSVAVSTSKKTTVSPELAALFDSARQAYPGTKRGLDTELANFRKQHADWRDILPRLLPAINQQTLVKQRLTAAGEFCPVWKNLSTLINQRCWEEETAMPEPQQQQQMDWN